VNGDGVTAQGRLRDSKTGGYSLMTAFDYSALQPEASQVVSYSHAGFQLLGVPASLTPEHHAEMQNFGMHWTPNCALH